MRLRQECPLSSTGILEVDHRTGLYPVFVYFTSETVWSLE